MARGVRANPWWVPLGGVVLALLYVPTLRTPFDFIDDGNLVYPTPAMPIGQRLGVVWEKIQANVEALGPFRPVLWAHWELQADLFDANPVVWRAARLCWCALAAMMLLWYLHELHIRPLAAILAGALAMWNPFRNEIWTSLTLAEGVAMPYAIFGLIAAFRARRAEDWRTRLAWDGAAVSATLLALGCKNVFVALIPAQMFLRLGANPWEMREAFRAHGWRLLVYALPIFPFVVHFVYFNSHWHTGQYRPPGPSFEQLLRYAKGLQGAISLDMVGVALIVSVAGIIARRAIRNVWQEHAVAITAGGLLLASGIAIYLPMDAVSGRYTMPAVWGLDVLIAVLLSEALAAPSLTWKRAAIGTMAMGLCAVAISNLGKQQRFAARAEMLWQAVEFVERQPLPADTSVAWISDPAANSGGRSASSTTTGLNVEEGIHFDWHLQARRHFVHPVQLLNEAGQIIDRPDIKLDRCQPATLVVTALDSPPPQLGVGWEEEVPVQRLDALGQSRGPIEIERRIIQRQAALRRMAALRSPPQLDFLPIDACQRLAALRKFSQ